MAKGNKRPAGLVNGSTNGYATFNGQPESTTFSPPKSSYSNASWFSRLVFGYANPVLETGNARQLEMDDLWELEGDNRTSAAYAKFKASYLRHSQSVVHAIAATFGGKFLLSGVGSATMAACAVFAPAVLHHVIDAFSQPVIDLENLSMWVAAFFASRLVNAFTEAHVNFNLEMALLQLTVSMKALIFEKAMLRSIQSKNDNDMVDVSNLCTSDIDNLMWAGYQINVVWVMPMQCAVVIYMLYDVLDVAAFAGLGIIFLSMAANYVVAKGYMDACNDIMKFKDVRMKVVKEAFGAIQIIKLNAWESKFLGRIREWRGKEIAAISRYLYLMAVSIFLFWGAPLCVSVTSFTTYSLVLGKELTAAKVFTAMVLFTSIRDPLSQFPEALQALLQAGLAIERMATYLAADEVHPDRISRATDGYSDDVVVAVEQATFKWKATTSPKPPVEGDSHELELDVIAKPVLCDVNVTIHQGDFVVVHGAVGSGKSSLCAALLGELTCDRGKVFARRGNVAYYSQQPWIQNMTIRDNILFGKPYDKVKYDKVIDACGLVKDIAMFPAGDRTEIGQKGVNLSGGQKARISLARACYSDADVYILDTPLAAVDAVVQSEIFNKCLCGLLEKKTVILVTHLHDIIESDAANVKLLIENNRVQVTYTERKQVRRAYANLHTEAEDTELNEHRDDIDDNDRKMRAASVSGTLVEDEEREDGRVSNEVFTAYVNALGGVKMLVTFVLVLIGWQSFTAGSDIWLSHWTGAKPGSETTATTEENMSVYALLTVGAGLFVFARALLTAYTGIKASRFLFDAMTQSLLYAPLHFFDANPIGRILNRYSEDISTIDFRLPFSFYGMLVASSVNLFRLLTAIYVIKWVGLLLLPLGWVYFHVGMYYLASSREVSRLMKISTSPILSHLAQSEEGVAVLRAFGEAYVDRAIAENFKRCDDSNRVWYAQTVVNQWFTVRVQMIGFCVVVLVISTLLTLHEYLSPGLVGLTFMYAVSIDMGLSWWVKSWSWMEMGMVSPERIVEYVGIPAEGHANDRAASGPSVAPSPSTVSSLRTNLVATWCSKGSPLTSTTTRRSASSVARVQASRVSRWHCSASMSWCQVVSYWTVWTSPRCSCRRCGPRCRSSHRCLCYSKAHCVRTWTRSTSTATWRSGPRLTR